MKINTKYRRSLKLSVAICTVLTSSNASSNDEKEKFKVDCESVVLLDANLVMAPPIGPAVGLANFVVGGRVSPATATTELLGPPVPQQDGTQAILVKLQYDFGGGDVLFAFARGTLSATERENVFSNSAKINYAGGTGRYEKAFGRFDGNGVLNFADLEVVMEGKGQVCNLMNNNPSNYIDHEKFKINYKGAWK